MQQLIDLRSETPEAACLAAIRRVFEQGRAALVAWSSGKDSSVLLNLVLAAAVQVQQAGGSPHIVVLHADVGVENPEIVRLARGELAKVRAFAQRRGLRVDIVVSRPSFWESFPVRVIGGRALPTFPDTRRDCTSSWKRLPNEAAIAGLVRACAAQGRPQPVLMTGVRRDESEARAANVKRRGETPLSCWTDDAGRLRLSPLLDWTSDDVWAYLGLCNAGAVEAYSDFAQTMQTYQAAGGSSCVVVADAAMQAHSKPCSSRFGCWACTAVREDRSLAQMIESDRSRYGYMEPLAGLRDFIANTQYDWSRRQFVGRAIVDGAIAIGADTYSPRMLADLLRYTLTAQKESGVAIIDEAQLLAIDARWSQYAIAPPFTALSIWLQVEAGARWPTPRVARVAKTPVPQLGLIHVGGDWNDDVACDLEVTGLRNPFGEAFSESCGPGLRTIANGRAVLDVEGDSEIELEAACLFMDFEAERMVAQRAGPVVDWTSGYQTYVGFGLIRPGRGQSSRVDAILRRSQWRQRHNLHGERSVDELLPRLSVRFPRQADLFAEATS
jgi:3'-phosphoadenosine 5'-phosphosulfate sulfotransferase (PAPS reductase)/FAD synthetase